MDIARIGCAVAVVLGLLATGCSREDDNPDKIKLEDTPITGDFVGRVEGTDAYVAIVVGGDGDVLAYVTDGAESVDWVDGALMRKFDKDVRLSNDGGAVLEVEFTGGGATGTFTRPGEESHEFAAATAQAPAGLYGAREFFDDGEYVAGWIVLADGSQRGAVRRYETPLALGEVDPTTFTVDSETFTVPGGVLRPRRVTTPDFLS